METVTPIFAYYATNYSGLITGNHSKHFTTIVKRSWTVVPDRSLANNITIRVDVVKYTYPRDIK